jgi:hypothetical protein
MRRVDLKGFHGPRADYIVATELDCSAEFFWLTGFLVWFVVGPGLFREGPGSPRNPEGMSLGGLPGPLGPPEPGSKKTKAYTFCWARRGGPEGLGGPKLRLETCEDDLPSGFAGAFATGWAQVSAKTIPTAMARTGRLTHRYGFFCGNR